MARLNDGLNGTLFSQSVANGLMAFVTPAEPNISGVLPSVARRAVLPAILPGTNREMLMQAVGHVKAFSGTAAHKADLFQHLGQQITRLSGNSWTAVRGAGTDGSHVFLGGAGEALVIDTQGRLFRGSLQGGGIKAASPGKFAIDYAKLKGL
jgi:hypothetical protein